MTDAEPFARAVGRRTRVADWLLLLAVPALLVAAFTLPRASRRALALSHADPTLLTAYTAHFVHLDLGHLAANLAVYALLAPTVYLLSALAGRRMLFRAALVTDLLALPFVLSALNLALPRDVLELGFSGVAMALFGLLPLALSAYADAVFGDDLDERTSPMLFFGTTAVIAVAVEPGDPRLGGVALASLFAAVLYTEYALGSVRLPSGSHLRDAARRAGYFELAVFAAVLFLLVPVVAFRPGTATAGVRNGYVHLLGFALGYVAAYGTAVVAPRLGEGNAGRSD